MNVLYLRRISIRRHRSIIRRWLEGLRHENIDACLYAAFRSRLDRFQVHVKELPQYRFVDLFRSAEHYCRSREITATFESDHRQEDLTDILHSKPARWVSRRARPAARIAWPAGPAEEVFLPVDIFWACAAQPAASLVRVRYDAAREKAVVEAASPDPATAESLVSEIVRHSAEASIYRNRVLSLRFEPATRDELGDVERPEMLRVLFVPEPKIAANDLVLEETTRQLVWRNVIDLYQRRDVLKAHGVPIRRGVLLHGPPGTGKTFTCRYICAQLPDTTRILVAGGALQQVTAVFALARLLQPSLVILEDVDLVFMARERNAQASILGELLDQMDGIRPHEEISFVLTTNDIDRIESAIKDRPGRISQCIHLGSPGGELRGRYLRHYLEPYATAAVDLDALVTRSSGATQAFLKDWVHRAVQIATERIGTKCGKLELRTEDFDTALREARSSGDGAGARIIGFLGEPSRI